MTMQQYIEQTYGMDWSENPEAVRIVAHMMILDEAMRAGQPVPAMIPVSVLRDMYCRVCGDVEHSSDECPDNCCWVCGALDHWSNKCPDNCCWNCGDWDHWSRQCPLRDAVVVEARGNTYDNMVEAMIDIKFRHLHGEDLMRAYLADVEDLQHRLASGEGHVILHERLRLLQVKVDDLKMVIQ